MRHAVAGLIVLVGCGFPKPPDLATGDAPHGHDAAIDGTTDGAHIDASVDGPAGMACYGTGLVMGLCFASPPTTALTFTTADGPIQTDTSNACLPQFANACVIAADKITVPGGVALRPTGSRALVLIGASSISVTGFIDASSHRLPVSQVGPAAGNAAVCAPGQQPMNIGGGGAGGYYQFPGASGGDGGGSPGGFSASSVPFGLHGGCLGQPGNDPSQAPGGAGGGAVYLISASIVIMNGGGILANGAGAVGAMSGNNGGGGGGAGGLIGLDAPQITNNGSLLANGGGGSQGAGNGNPGAPGSDPPFDGSSAPGGQGGSSGGSGGSGGTAPSPMGNSGSNGGIFGGGGGGGAVGYIKVYQAAGISGSGVTSPQPTF